MINRNDFVAGGADRVFLNTVEGLKSCRVEGLEVAMFSRSDLVSRKDDDPRKLTFLQRLIAVRSYLYNKEVAAALEKRVLEFRPDVAHIHLIFGTLSLSVLRVLRKHKVPMVMTVHDYRLVCPANAMLDRHGVVCEKCEGRKYYKCLVNRCSEGNVFFSAVIMIEAYLRKFVTRPIKLIDHFIFVSQFAKAKHIQFNRGFKMKSSHLYNFTGSKKPPQTSCGDYFLFFGRLSNEKGVGTLIEAFIEHRGDIEHRAQSTELRQGIKLRIVGSGPLDDFVKKSCQRPTAECQLEYLGFKAGTELEQIIANCSFVIVPSEWYENNPMTIVEAFSMGKPVIGANIGGIPELVNKETGFLFESGNIDSLIEARKKAQDLSEEEYARMSKACYQFYLENFEKEKHFNELINKYKSVS